MHFLGGGVMGARLFINWIEKLKLLQFQYMTIFYLVSGQRIKSVPPEIYRITLHHLSNLKLTAHSIKKKKTNHIDFFTIF